MLIINIRSVFFLLSAVLLSFVVACSGRGEKQVKSASSVDMSLEQVEVRYAKGFSVENIAGAYLVDIEDPQREGGANGTRYRYAFVYDKEKFDQSDERCNGYEKVNIPVTKVVCMTTLQLSNFIALEEIDKVVGITSTRHLFNKRVNEKVKNKEIRKIGIEGNFDNEVIIAIDPDVIFISPFKRGGYESIKEVGIPLIPHLGYKESSPLAQAEWIKFVGLLTDCLPKATALFSEIEVEYNSLKKMTEGIEDRPTVFSGDLKGGNWYAVGGESFLAQVFRDAGADYFLKDDKNTGGVTLDFETVYSKAAKCRYWRLLNSYDGQFSYEALREMDSRYADFDAFKNKGVIYCNLSSTAYYEDAPTHPHLLLKDFIKVFHPDLLADYVPTFYKLMD